MGIMIAKPLFILMNTPTAHRTSMMVPMGTV